MAERDSASPPAPAVRASTPIAGAIAGILFAMLFSTAVGLMIATMGELVGDTGAWLVTGAKQFELALTMIPFAGIFFLWFIAASREHLGRHEDQFFATVFLGSGLLFLAMIFAAAAAASALAAAYALDPVRFVSSGMYQYARLMVAKIFAVYALRMAAVFMISEATLWLRTGVMPTWMAYTSYAVAVVLLFVVSQSLWVVMVFPAWVFLVSVYILVLRLRAPEPLAAAD